MALSIMIPHNGGIILNHEQFQNSKYAVMKKVFILVLLALVVKCGFTQQLPVNEPATNYVVEKLKIQSKRSFTRAWLFVAGGAICMIVGITTYPHHSTTHYDASEWGEFAPLFAGDYPNEFTAAQKNQQKVSDAFLIGGVIMELASIPFFINGGIKDHKARVMIRSQKTGFGLPFRSLDVNGLSLCFSL